MLEVDNISLYYGAAQALRGVSVKAEATSRPSYSDAAIQRSL